MSCEWPRFWARIHSERRGARQRPRHRLSHGLWRSRFGGQANILDSSVRLDGDSYRVIGVMPEGFGFMSRDVGAYVPFAFTPAQRSDASRGNQFSNSVGRLRDGATVAGLESELATIVQRNVAEGHLEADAVTVAGFMGRAEPLRDRQVGDLVRHC